MDNATSPRTGFARTVLWFLAPIQVVKDLIPTRTEESKRRFTAFTTYGRGAKSWLCGFLKRFTRNMGTSTFSHVPYTDPTTWMLRNTGCTTPTVGGEIPELDQKTTWSWNKHELPVNWATAFWLGWGDGYSKRVETKDPLRHLNLGAMFNRAFYDFGLSLGESGVSAGNAMCHLVQLVNDEATDRSKGDWG